MSKLDVGSLPVYPAKMTTAIVVVALVAGAGVDFDADAVGLIDYPSLHQPRRRDLYVTNRAALCCACLEYDCRRETSRVRR